MTGRRARLADLLNSLRPYDGLTYFYNLDNNRRARQVAREIRAMAKDKPDTIELVECIGNRLPLLPGYGILRDTTTRSRENVAVYYRAGLPVEGPWWIDLRETWDRTNPGATGVHEARSYLVYRIGGFQRIVAQQPPNFTDNSRAAQLEGLYALADRLAPWRRSRSWGTAGPWRRLVQRARPRMLTWDAQRRVGETGPGPDMLAGLVGGRVHLGGRIDHLIERHVRVRSARFVEVVNGVALESDHGRAVRVRWRVAGRWVRRGGVRR
ncbi:MAG: hypothetical protein CMF72_24640 [Mameliella sp.]|nr:hypothetical protein [Mameliella sp.]